MMIVCKPSHIPLPSFMLLLSYKRRQFKIFVVDFLTSQHETPSAVDLDPTFGFLNRKLAQKCFKIIIKSEKCSFRILNRIELLLIFSFTTRKLSVIKTHLHNKDVLTFKINISRCKNSCFLLYNSNLINKKFFKKKVCILVKQMSYMS